MGLGYDADDDALTRFQYGPCVDILSECPDCDMKDYTVTISGILYESPYNLTPYNGAHTVTADALGQWVMTPFVSGSITYNMTLRRLGGSGSRSWEVFCNTSGVGTLFVKYLISGDECCPNNDIYPYSSKFNVSRENVEDSICTVS